MDLQHVDPARVGVPVTLVAMTPDAIAPAWQVRELYERLGPGHELVEVLSTCGHDGFLIDVGVFSEVVARFLDQGRSS
jgi:homoserine acetyltransferase